MHLQHHILHMLARGEGVLPSIHSQVHQSIVACTLFTTQPPPSALPQQPSSHQYWPILYTVVESTFICASPPTHPSSSPQTYGQPTATLACTSPASTLSHLPLHTALLIVVCGYSIYVKKTDTLSFTSPHFHPSSSSPPTRTTVTTTTPCPH